MDQVLTETEERMVQIVQGLAQSGSEATTEAAANSIGYSHAGAAYILKKLEERGIVRSRKITGSRKLAWLPVNKFDTLVTDDESAELPEPETPAPLPAAAAPLDQGALLDEYVKATVEMEHLRLEHGRLLNAQQEKLNTLRAQLLGQVAPIIMRPPVQGPPPSPAKLTLSDQVATLIERNGPLSVGEIANRMPGDMDNLRVRGIIANLLRRSRVHRREDGRYELTGAVNGAN